MSNTVTDWTRNSQETETSAALRFECCAIAVIILSASLQATTVLKPLYIPHYQFPRMGLVSQELLPHNYYYYIKFDRNARLALPRLTPSV